MCFVAGERDKAKCLWWQSCSVEKETIKRSLNAFRNSELDSGQTVQAPAGVQCVHLVCGSSDQAISRLWFEASNRRLFPWPGSILTSLARVNKTAPQIDHMRCVQRSTSGSGSGSIPLISH
jgi:hypothetical protein